MILKQTPLNNQCLQAGGRMVPFAGWEMPVQFAGLINEHQAVRQFAGIFDISHMGVFLLEGNNPKDILQSLVPSDLHRIGPGEACYTVLLNENGGIIDDLIIYDLGARNGNPAQLLLVVNAACTDSDLTWIRKHLESSNISITDAKDDKCLIALQGPKAQEVLEKVSGQSLSKIPRFGHCEIELTSIGLDVNSPIFISRTGYTGEDGFELLISSKGGNLLWSKLTEIGVTPCGLGARDTLRLEAAMHLYGNEINSSTTPLEAGLGWLVHLEMPAQFLGRKVLERQAQEGIKHRLIGLKIQGRGIARQGHLVIHKDKKIGEITSGTWSPTLQEAIALAYVPTEASKPGNLLEVEVRGKRHSAEVVKLPFYRRKKDY